MKSYHVILLLLIVFSACAQAVDSASEPAPSTEPVATTSPDPSMIDTEPAPAVDSSPTAGSAPKPVTMAPPPPSNYPKFPLPPPRPSSKSTVSMDYFANCATVGSVNKKLTQALIDCGYSQHTYYAVPGGFALVTQFESFNDDGTSKKGAARWSESLKESGNFSLKNFLKNLVNAKKGFYRIFVFIFTDDIITSSNKKIGVNEAKSWLESGASKLPKTLAEYEFNKSDYNMEAFVYEFKKNENDTLAYQVNPSRLSAQDHLVKSNIINKLKL